MPQVQQREKPTPKPTIKVACCVPIQHYNREDKLAWLDRALGETDCHLFITPQEWMGGHYIMKDDLHMDRDWLDETIGNLARKHKKHIGLGACEKTATSGAMEAYIYYDDTGERLGAHYKFALPAYDDVRAEGHGQLWPETSWERRATPIAIPRLRLRVGTIFCWEVFTQTLWSAYSLQGVTLVTHPIKFAPRGWLINRVLDDGRKHIVDFGYAPKSQMWVDRLIMAGRHQVMCPIAVSCNSWNLGPKKMALTGHVDEMKKTTELIDFPSVGTEEKIHTFEMLPEFYTGIDNHHSAGAFVAHIGSIDGYSEMGEWTMAGKIRRLEAHLIGGTTKLDCILKSAAAGRQKKSTVKRALGSGLQKVHLTQKGKKA